MKNKCFYLKNGMRINGDPDMPEKTKDALMKMGDLAVKMLTDFSKFKPFQNDSERNCWGCQEKIKIGFVCRNSANVFVHDLDCWGKFQKNNQSGNLAE